MTNDPYGPARRIPATPPLGIAGPPAQLHGTPPHGFRPADPAPRSNAKWPFAVLAAAVVVLGFGAWSLYDRGVVLKDSGIKACEALASGDKTFAGGKQNKTPMTEAQYRELRGVFEDSRHDDIKDHGTKLMDVVWQMSAALKGDANGMGALVYLQPLTTHMTGLQSACADQGIIVTLQQQAPTEAEAAKAAPKCSDVFQPGKTIAKDFAGECLNKDGSPWSPMGLDCNDGRKLFQVGVVEGAEPGWGFAGGKYVAEDTTAFDSKYNDAMTKCI